MITFQCDQCSLIIPEGKGISVSVSPGGEILIWPLGEEGPFSEQRVEQGWEHEGHLHLEGCFSEWIQVVYSPAEGEEMLLPPPPAGPSERTSRVVQMPTMPDDDSGSLA